MSDAASTTAAHLDAVRRRGRHLMALESETGVRAEIFHSASAARDGLILMLSLWLILQGVRFSGDSALVVLAAALSLALYTGIANGLAISSQLRFWHAELQRERGEIRTQPDFERDEVRALYEAKGFSGPILDEIVETLCADEDRLLKIMLEEELGIFFEQANHPVVMGFLTGSAALLGGLAIAITGFLGPWWAPVLAVFVLLAVVSVIRTGQSLSLAVRSFGRWAVTAAAVGGIAYHVAELLATVHGSAGAP